MALLQARSEIPSRLDAELEATIDKLFHLQPTTLAVGKASELDALGSAIWNAATNLLRDEENHESGRKDDVSSTRLTVLLRVFAYLFIDAAHRSPSSRRRSAEQQVRTFKIALKACRTCLDRGELRFAYSIFQRLADFVGKCEAVSPVVQLADDPDADRQHILKRLVTEYYLLRMTHDWKSDRLDLADLSYSKISSALLTEHAYLGERAADLFHQMGKSLLAKTLHEMAIKWCERSIDILNACDAATLCLDAPELRLATTSTLVASLVAANNRKCRDRAATLVLQLDTVHGLGNRTAVYLLKFNLLIADPKEDTQLIYETVSRMIVLTVLTDKSFRLFVDHLLSLSSTWLTFHSLMQTLHHARRAKMPWVLDALSDLVVKRLIPDIDGADAESPSRVRLEKALVTHVMFATTQADGRPSDPIASLRHLLNTTVQTCDRALSAKATHAAQTLMWKATGSSFDPAAADEWCSLMRHPIFASAGQINKARVWRCVEHRAMSVAHLTVYRKSIHSALARDDLDAARQIYFSMPKNMQDESLTRYLCFKLALRSKDVDFATESLRLIVKSADRTPNLLFACVLDAQQSDLRQMATSALLSVLDRRSPGIHLPSLLRCTVRLLISEVEARARSLDEIMREVGHVFKTAAANTKDLRQGSDEQWRAEIQWWSKNAYNLALQFCGEMHPEQLTDLLQACTKFLSCYPIDGSLMLPKDINRRQMLCHFLCATAQLVLGRANPEDIASSLQCYVRVRQHIATFQALASDHNPITGNDDDDDSDSQAMLARAFELLKFDLEAILKLQQWDQLDASLQSILYFPASNCWESAIDLLFTIYDQATASGVDPALTARIPDVLQKCTNESWKQDKDIVKMARWLRLIFTLHQGSSSEAFARKILSQAAAIAKRGDEGRNDRYPADELAWLATTAFNKGVDLLAIEDDEGAALWIDGALEMARYADDEGGLHARLTASKNMADQRKGARAATRLA